MPWCITSHASAVLNADSCTGRGTSITPLLSFGHALIFDYTARVRAHIHRFLLMLLMLALPLQAFAAASMLDCMLVPPALAETDGMMPGCHEPEQPDAPPARHDCKHCAACALGSALPIPATDSPAIISLRCGFTPSLATAFSGFIPDGPERPPRPALA